jgi:DNA gyrase subunit A
MASNIPSFNLEEVCNAVTAILQNKPQAQLIPDFATGGELLYNPEEMNKIAETGRGGFKVRAVWVFDAKNSCIEVKQIPYTTTIEAIMDKIHAQIKSGKMREITDVRDETDLKGLKIAIDIKKSADPENIMQRLFASTPLMDSFSCNFNILINGRPRVMGISEILHHWINFRRASIKGRVAFDLQKNKEKLHLLEGLAKILLDIDKAIAIIRGTKSDKDVIPNLCKGFDIDKTQAEFIAEIKLRNLNQDYLLKRVKEQENLEKEIKKLEDILKDGSKVNEIIIAEQKEIIKKHAIPRKTMIIDAVKIEKPPQIHIENYPIALYLTAENYFKKIHATALRTNPTIYVKQDDAVTLQIQAQNTYDILFFSNKHNVYKVKAYDLDDNRPSQLGSYLNNILPCDDNEKIIFIAATADYSGHLLFAFQNGKAALVTLESYATLTGRKKLVNALSNKSPLLYAEHLQHHKTYYVATRDKKRNERFFLFNTALLPIYSAKNAGGVQLAKDELISLNEITNEPQPNIPTADKLPYRGEPSSPTEAPQQLTL